MKFGRFVFKFSREPKPLSAETVTLLSQLVDDRFALIEAEHKVTRQRLETVYRKVYRDLARDGEEPVVPVIPKTTDRRFSPRPGDPLED